MDVYTPIVAIVLYIGSLLAPDGMNELTYVGDGQVITFTRDQNTWSLKNDPAATITLEDGYIIERNEASNGKDFKERLSDHIPIPLDLNKGVIDLKRSPLKIEFEQKEELVIFTVTPKGQPSVDIRISWTD